MSTPPARPAGSSGGSSPATSGATWSDPPSSCRTSRAARRTCRPPFLRKFAVPFWALTEVFGRSPMYWYRLERSLGRASLVGTTVQAPERLPRHLAADEKHTTLVDGK